MKKCKTYLVRLQQSKNDKWSRLLSCSQYGSDLVTAANPVRAAEIVTETYRRYLRPGQSCRIMVCPMRHRPDREEFCISADSNGEARYDIKWSNADGEPYPVYSEKSHA